MKKLLQIPLLLVALFLTSIPISAHDFSAGGIYYNILTDSTVAVTYKGIYSSSYSNEYTGAITIPSSVTYNSTTYSVTEIGFTAFKDCSGLTSVTIPNSVTSIRSEAFESSGLTSVTIGNSVTSIGDAAFRYCSGLTEVNITDLSAWCKINFGSYYTNPLRYAKKLKLNGTEIKDLVIPNDITKIKSYAFEHCSSLTSVTIPNSVTSIGDDAFYGCSGLTSVTIPNSVTTIGSNAFSGCSGLTSVTIPNSVTSISFYAFSGCSGLTSVTIPNSVTTIGSWAFSGCSGLTSVTIPNSVTMIGCEAFTDCTGLTEVNITDLSAWCKINFDNSSYFSPSNPLRYANKLKLNGIEIKDLVIPNDITEIKNYAFYGCSGLTSVTIPNSVTTIGNGAFLDCTGLTSVTIPNSVTEISSNAFYGCSGLTSVTIPNSVTSIGSNAFSGCSGLTSVTIPNSVTEISSYAFSGCSGLTSVTIPNSVTSIDDRAFYKCTGLVDCNIETTHTSATIGLSSDSNCSPYFYYNGEYYKDGDIITGLSPYTNASNWSTSSGRYYYEYGLTVNNISCEIYSNYFYTKQINLYIDGTAGVTYVNCSWSHTDDEATLVSEKITVNNSSIESEDNTIQIKNSDPNTSYTFDYTLKYKEFNSNFNISKTFTTGELNLTTQEAKPTSTTSVRLLAATNCDATEGTGFEWRRYDAPEELPSSKVSCPVVDGVLVGSLRGVKDDVYYKYRPFYTSSSGKTYYGDWIAFFTGDANVYFEPEVRTYEDIQVINNSATVKGYALEGTDVITSQGFEYWKTGSTIKPASTDDRMTVSASGISMSATLANLEYNSTYKYRAYVTTAKGTIYGDEMEFSTGEDPSGIGYIEIDSDEFVVTLRENPATGTAWVKLAGAAGEEVQYTLTSMSGAMVANGTVLLDGEWNAIDLNCSAGMYLLTINDGTQVKTLRLIVK